MDSIRREAPYTGEHLLHRPLMKPITRYTAVMDLQAISSIVLPK